MLILFHKKVDLRKPCGYHVYKIGPFDVNNFFNGSDFKKLKEIEHSKSTAVLYAKDKNSNIVRITKLIIEENLTIKLKEDGGFCEVGYDFPREINEDNEEEDLEDYLDKLNKPKPWATPPDWGKISDTASSYIIKGIVKKKRKRNAK